EVGRTVGAAQPRTRQQAAVAALGQRALMEENLDALLAEAARLVSQTLEVRFSMLMEVLPDRTGMQLRAGEGWKAGSVGSSTMPADAGSQGAYTLEATGPAVSEDPSRATSCAVA